MKSFALGCGGIIAAVGVFVLITALSLLGVYNGLQTSDERCNEAWGNVESVLQRRMDLIPNLVETTKAYSAHEKDTFTAVTKARQQVNNVNLKGIIDNPAEMQKLAAAQESLSGAISRLLVVQEKYPELKADQQFLKLQDELAGTENRINYARQEYNGAVVAVNNRIRVWPSSMLAGFAGITPRTYFKADDSASKAPVVKF